MFEITSHAMLCHFYLHFIILVFKKAMLSREIALLSPLLFLYDNVIIDKTINVIMSKLISMINIIIFGKLILMLISLLLFLKLLLLMLF